MSFYKRYVVPRLTHLAMRQKQLLPFRQRVVGAAEGRVLEIGIGSGLNFPLYGGAVKSVIGLEPSPELLRMARPRAEAAAMSSAFFQSAQKFKTRYATLDFSDKANLDDGHMWPTAYALKELTAAEEAKVATLVKKVVN